MIDDPTCPACGANHWTDIGERTYCRPPSLDGRGQKPMRVLFEIWAPGAEEVRVRFAGCNDCGMMIYRPRPSESDLAAKYRALALYGDNIPSSEEDPARTGKRAQRIYDILAPHMKRAPGRCRLLDFGGGDGRLLKRFVEVGAACELIDYCDAPVAGVRQVGSTIDSLPGEAVYDGMICSHVIEHLADPLPVLEALAANLKPDGAIYVEVPVEMVKKMPAPSEPVTHCNFFIPESLSTLLERAGFRVLKCRLTVYPHPNGGWSLCAGAIAEPGTKAAGTKAGFSALQRYLRPPPLFDLQLRLKMWRAQPKRLARAVRARLRPASSHPRVGAGEEAARLLSERKPHG
jgi:SAM-dependent methyltransferase